MERIGTYDVLGHLGRGGMGVVLRARCAVSGREVALKVLDPALLTADGRSRFEREVLALTRLRHPHVVGVLGAGASPHGPWVAMELVEGESLQARLERSGPLAPADVVAVGRALCGALAHAHGMGVVHRDVKPGNVLLGRDGRVVLVDFGLARLTGRESRLTVTGEMVGTPCFMAPEQAQGEEHVGPPADVYSVGATLYAALTGRPPITGRGLIEVLDKLITEVPPPPSALRPGVPPALSDLVMRCLEKAPDLRPASAEALEAALAGAPEPRADEPRPERADVPRSRQRSPRHGVTAALAAVVGAGLVGRSVQLRARADDDLAAAEASAQVLDVDMLVMRGRAQVYRSRDPAGALDTAQAALRLAPDDLRALALRAAAWWMLGRLPEARADVARLAAAKEASPAILLDTAALARNLEDHPLSLALAERALGAGALDAPAEAMRVAALIELSRPREALEVTLAALQRFPEHPVLLWHQAAALMKVDRAAGRELVAQIAARRPTDVTWQGLRAQLLEADDPAGAEAVWTRYLEARPDDLTALRARARLRGRRQDWLGAASDLTRVTALEPDDARAWQGLVDALRRRDDKAGTLAAIDRFLRLRPDDAGAWAVRGQLMHALARDDEAILDLSKAVELAPEFAQAWSDRGILRVVRGDAAGGASDLERAVALEPDHPTSWLNLTRARLDLGQHAGALDAARQAIRLRPKDPTGHAFMARVHLALGERVAALAACDRAQELAGDTPERALLTELDAIRAAAAGP